MNLEIVDAFGELEQPYWKFWRWGKRKKAEFVLDAALFSFEQKASAPDRVGELIEQLYGCYIGGCDAPNRTSGFQPEGTALVICDCCPPLASEFNG